MEDPNRDDPFYVGYLPKAPASLAKWLRPRILLLLLLPLAMGAVIVLSQNEFGPGTFEFQNYREFEGVLLEEPVPALQLLRPGLEKDDRSIYYLVEFGKKGGQDAVAGLHGKRAKVRGALIFRGNQTMLELDSGPGAVQIIQDDSPASVPSSLGRVTLQGEIVDSKCFFGVMKPGNLKPHKACAIRCISGGIPPVLLVRNKQDEVRYVLLVSSEGKAVNQQVLKWVAEPVEVSGQLERWGDYDVLKADLETLGHPD